ncbi:ATP-binding cassette sub-family A member 13 [Pleurodeles waltl]|uniref:ATP-binding cassette sub-family A member 13 n=1 Tax=Pleurodeles waltl TaxID=8319 RepID=UPI003709A738
MISELESLHNQPYIWDLLLSLPLLAGNIQKDGFLNTGFQGLSQLLQTIRNSLTAVDILNVLPDNTMKDDFHRKIDKGLNISIMLLNFLHDWRSKQDLRFNLSLQYVVWNPESVIEELQSRFGLRSQQAEKVLNFTSVFKMVPTHGELEELICSAVSSAVDIPGENASQASRCASSWKEATNFLVQSIDKLELYKQAFFQWNISSMMQVMLQEIENSLHNSSDDSLVEKLVSVLNHIIQVSRGHSEEPQDLVVPSIKKDVKMKEGTYFKEEAMVFISNLAEYVKQLFNSNDSFPSSIPEMRALIDNILDHATTGIHSLSNVTAEESDDDLQMLSGFIDEILDRVHLITSLWPEDQSSEYFWQIMMTPILNEFVLALQNPVADGHLKSDMLKHLWLTFVSFSTPEEQEMLNTSLHFFKTFHSDMKGLPAGDVDYAKLGELFMTDLSKIGLLDQAHGAAILNLVNFIKNASASEKLSYAENIFQAGELEKILKDLHHNMSDDSQRSATMLLEILTTINHNADTFFNIKPNVSLFGSLDDISKVTSPMLRQFDIPIIRRNFTFLDGAIKVLQDLTHGSLCEQILSVYTFLEDYAQYCTQNGDVEMQLVYPTLLSLKTFFAERNVQNVVFQYLNQLLNSSPDSLLNFSCTENRHGESSPLNHSSGSHHTVTQELLDVLTNIDSSLNGGKGLLSLGCLLTWFQVGTKSLQEMSHILEVDLKYIIQLHNGLSYLTERMNITVDNITCTTALLTFNLTARFARDFLTNVTKATDVKLWNNFETLGEFMRTLSIMINATSSNDTEYLMRIFATIESIITRWEKFTLGGNKSSDALLHILSNVTLMSSYIKPLDESYFPFENALSNMLSHPGNILESPILVELKKVTGLLQNVSFDKDMLLCSELFSDVSRSVSESLAVWNNKSQTNYLAAVITPLLNFNTTVNGVIGWEKCKHIYETLGHIHDSFPTNPHTKDFLTFLIYLMSTNKTDSMIAGSLNLVSMALNMTANSAAKNGLHEYLSSLASMLPLTSPSVQGQEHIKLAKLITTLLNKTDGNIETIINHLQTYLQYVGYIPKSDPMIFDSHTITAFNITEGIPVFFRNHGHQSTELLNEIRNLLNHLSTKAWQINMTSASISDFFGEKEYQTLLRILEGPDFKSYISKLQHMFINLTALLDDLKASLDEDAKLGMMNEWQEMLDGIDSWNLNTTSHLSQLLGKSNYRAILFMVSTLHDLMTLLEGMHDKNITEILIDSYRFWRTHETLMSTFAKHNFSITENSFLQMLLFLVEMPDEPTPVFECLLALFFCNQRELMSSGSLRNATFKNCNAKAMNLSSKHPRLTDLIQHLTLALPNDDINCAEDSFLVELTDNGVCFFHQFEELSLILSNVSEMYHINCSHMNEISQFWGKLSSNVPKSTPRLNRTICSSTPFIQAVRKLAELLHHTQATGLAPNRTLGLIFDALNMNKEADMHLFNKVFSFFKTVANTEENSTSILPKFLAEIPPFLTVSSKGSLVHMLLSLFSDMYMKKNLVGDFVTMWVDMNNTLNRLMTDQNVTSFLADIEKHIEFIRFNHQNYPRLLFNMLRHFNTTTMGNSLLPLGDFFEVINDWPNEYTNTNYSTLFKTLILLCPKANESEQFVRGLSNMFQLISQLSNYMSPAGVPAELLDLRKLFCHAFHSLSEGTGFHGMNISSPYTQKTFERFLPEALLFANNGQDNDPFTTNSTSDMLNEFVEVHPPPSLLESDVTQLLGLLRRETYVDPSDGTSMAMILMDALLKYIQQTFHMKSNENIFKPTQQDNSGDDDIMHLPNLLQGIMEMFSNESTQFSRNETNGNIHAAFDEYWQLALQNNESFFEVCQHLEASVDPAHVELLQKAQTALLNILTVLAENPVFTRNSHCIFSSCQGRSTRRFLVSMIEGFNLLHTQDLKAVWPESVNIDCASVDSTSQELSMMLNTMKQFVQDPEFNTICQCILPLDNIQEHLKNLEGSLSELLSRNPAIAFLSNSSMPAGIKVRDCVQNVTALETDIHALINISDRTINTILEANLSSSKFVYSTLAMALVEECNEEVLGLLLTFPKGEDTPLALEELCSLSTMEIYKLSVLIMEHLDLRNIMYKVKIPSDKNTMLTTLLDLVSRVSAIVDKLQNIVGNLPDFSKAFQSIPLVDVSEFQQFLRAGQSRRSAFGSLQSLIKSVCKEESNFFTNDDMFARMPQITELLKKDMEKYSIPENSTQFCLQFYQEILQSPNGALVWTFLKPLLHGKILYTPDLPEIRLVVEKANHIFDHVKSLKTYSEAWLSMSQIFQTTGQFLMVNHLQMFLQNNFIRNFVESQLNIDLKKLIENLQEYGSTMNKMLNNTATKQINMLSQFMVDISSCVLLDRFQPLNTSEELEQKATELMQQNNFLASIIFNVSSSKSREEHKSSHPLPPHVFYTIRTSVVYSMKTDNTKNPMWKSHPQQLPAAGFAYNHVFAPLQDMVERAITSVQTGKELLEPEVQVQAMPYPCHTSDLFLTNIGFFFPLIMMLTWMISVASMVRKSVHEKEIRLEEYMKMMGVHPSVHFLAWVLENIIMLAISSCTLVVILKVSGILFQSNGFILFIFFIDFGIAVIMMSYLISAFFSSANTACLCASLIYMISFLPYIVLLVLQKQFSLVTQTIVCLLSTTAFGQGIFLITFFEGQGTGIQWSNFYQPLEEAGAMNFGWASGMILIDSLIYFVAGWYFSNVIPGTFGSAKPWYFPLTVSYWKNLCGAENRRKHYLNSNMVFFNENLRHKGSLKHDSTTAGLERPPPGLEVGVDIMSVTKEYAGNTIAVNNLSLSFFKGQITALLGPNGAGKTTIISMLTGLYPASYGDILINGKDIHTELTSIRMEMGVCPQYDVLFDTLTVQEHLLLYGTVKAPFWGKKTLQLEVKRALQDVGLVLHKNKRVQALSGGMKRRLSIAISFMGNSRTVVLDEPTSGVDPCSRRSIWEILLKYKTGRTIIFTTHHLDEAEVLSDRIAILQHGQLRCCGSPCYLKERFGQGHSITLTRKHSMFDNQDPEGTIQITSLVQSFIPNAFLKEKSSTEITYMIPAMAEKAAFEQLFQALDENMQMLHLTGYGISDTTLEEIFLKLIQHPEEQPPIHLDVDLEASQGSEPVCHNNSLLMEAGTLEGWCLTLTQITSLLIKQFHHQRRDWRGALSKLFLPIVFVIMAMALFTLKPLTIEYPSLKLSPELYNGPSGCFYSADGVDSANLSHVLLRQFVGRDSLCNASRDDMRSYTCWSTETGAEHAFIEHCPYLQGQKKCPACNISAPYLKNSRGQVLYNLSGLDLEEYLITPLKRERFGGWSFGTKTSLKSQDKKPTKPQAKVWYSHKGFHALPSYLNQMNNMILWRNLPSTLDWKQYGITLYSKPYGGTLLNEDKILENVRQCGVALCIMLGFSILTASIGSAIVKDRVSGAKRLQHIAGLNYQVYWLANFIYDMLFYLVPVCLCVCVIAAFQLTAFTFRENLAATALLLTLFGYATLPWMYLISRFFSSSDVAFITYISINFVCGLCTLFLTLLPKLLSVMSKSENLTYIYSILRWAFLIFPQFCLGQGLMELSYNQAKFDLTSSFGIDSYVSPFQMDFLGWIFVAMALQGSLLLLLRLLLHWDLLQNQRGRPSVHRMISPSGDQDVEAERVRVFAGYTGKDILMLYNLRKCYKRFNKKTVAVNDISLGIPRGECFGLLGVNGAGKSTTFKMLTSDIPPTAGQAVIRTPSGSERDILDACKEGTLIGYCPQQDALDELLTGWEHLYYYCSLRGIPKQYIHKVSRDLVNRLHLGGHVDKLVKTYSGGTKRKLSTALALVGKPQILLLDEPSSGMDPCSKRYLWKTILKEVQDGCAAVLTSHSMEECEALCSRLAIMVNGSFKCLGSPQHIKNRFGDGYSVKVWLTKDANSSTAVSDCLKLHFPGTLFKEQHLNLLEYRVLQRKGCLAELFKTLETNKHLLHIEHYSISETSLEQVFINFAAQSHEASGCIAESVSEENTRYVLS